MMIFTLISCKIANMPLRNDTSYRSKNQIIMLMMLMVISMRRMIIYPIMRKDNGVDGGNDYDGGYVDDGNNVGHW